MHKVIRSDKQFPNWTILVFYYTRIQCEDNSPGWRWTTPLRFRIHYSHISSFDMWFLHLRVATPFPASSTRVWVSDFACQTPQLANLLSRFPSWATVPLHFSIVYSDSHWWEKFVGRQVWFFYCYEICRSWRRYDSTKFLFGHFETKQRQFTRWSESPSLFSRENWLKISFFLSSRKRQREINLST